MERCAVITVSDRSAAGRRPDTSGPALAAVLETAGYTVQLAVVPDGQSSVREALLAALATGARLILTTGGTGVGPRDRTPEATASVIDRALPGVADLLRSRGAAHSVHAALSRGVVGVVDASSAGAGALIVNLPGSPNAAVEGADVVLPLVAHVLDQLAGGDH
ncbi:MAG: MogA/MoaB family molybdenum cofactor biosynthesis protein [Propionicimonas sp.]